MFWAIYNNNNFAMLDLMNRGATLDYLSKDRLNFLLKRLVYKIQGNQDIIEMLIAKGAELSPINQNDFYELLKIGDLNSIQKYFKIGFKFNFDDPYLLDIVLDENNNRNDLFFIKKQEIFWFLVNNNVPFDKNDKKILEFAVKDSKFNSWKNVRLLLEKGFQFQNHLKFLLENAQKSVIELLLENGVVFDKNDKKIVNTAIRKNKNIVMVLIEHGFVFNKTDKKILEIAIKNSHFYAQLKYIQLLLEKGFEFDKTDVNPINIATKKGFISLIKFFIVNGFAIDRNNNNLLYLALEKKDYEFFNFLLEYIDLDKNDAKLLSKIIKTKNLDFIKKMIEKGLEINNILIPDKEVLISLVLKEDDVNFFKWLYNEGFIDIHHNSIIYLLERKIFTKRHVEILKFLISKGYIIKRYRFDLDFITKHIHDKNLIKIMIENQPELIRDDKFIILTTRNLNFDIIEYLVREKGIDINLNTPDLITWSIKNKELNFILLLVEKGIDINPYMDNKMIKSLLKKTLATDNLDFFKFLLGRNPDLLDSSTLLKISKTAGYKIIKYLMDIGIDFTRYEKKILSNIFENDDLGLFKLLQEKNNRMINETYFIKAISNKNYKIISYLLENGKSVYTNNNYAINTAIENGDLKLIEILVNYGADPLLFNNHIISNINNENNHTEDRINTFNEEENEIDAIRDDDIDNIIGDLDLD